MIGATTRTYRRVPAPARRASTFPTTSSTGLWSNIVNGTSTAIRIRAVSAAYASRRATGILVRDVWWHGAWIECPVPGSKDLVLELYRKLVSPKVEMKDLHAQTPINSPFGNLNPGDYNPHNKWNTTHSIVHLTAPPNALTAEIQLGADATQLYRHAHGNPVVDPDAFIAGTGMGGPNRNSDPTIAATVNALARAGAMITLANPVGLYMDHIDLAGWEFPGGMSRNDCVHVVRGQPHLIERLVVEVPGGEFTVSDITIGGVPIAFGGHIAECITVSSSARRGRLARRTIRRCRCRPSEMSIPSAPAKFSYAREWGCPTGPSRPSSMKAENWSSEVTRAALASARPVRGSDEQRR